MELSISSYTPVNTVLDYCFTLFFVCFLITSANDDESLPFCPCCCYLWLPLTISMQRQSFCVLWHRLISRLMRKFQDVKQVLLHSETYLSIHSLWFLQNLLYFQFFYFTKWLAVTMDLTAATATWLIGLMLTNVTHAGFPWWWEGEQRRDAHRRAMGNYQRDRKWSNRLHKWD